MRKALFLISIILCLAAAVSAQITVKSPNGNENWQLASQQSISWTAPGVTKKLKIILFKDGRNLGLIATGLAAGSSPYTWNCGQYQGGTAAVTGGYKIYVGTLDNSIEDFSDNVFAIAPAAPVIVKLPEHRLPPPFPLGGPKLAVTAINLVRDASGYGIIFGYKNVGTAALPKRHELPVKPDYRVLIDGREIDKGDLFIPESPPAGPGWELATNSGGSINFPVYEPRPWYIGKEITINLNERNALNMGSASKTSSLLPIVLTVGYDLAFAGPAVIDWNANRARVTITKVGSSPQNSKHFNLNCTVGYYHKNTVSGGPLEATVTYPEGAYTKQESREIPSTGPFPWHLDIPLEASSYYDLEFHITSESRDEFDERNNALPRVRYERPGTPPGPRITAMAFSKRTDSDGKTSLRTTLTIGNMGNAACGGLRLLLKRNGSQAQEWAGISLAPGQKQIYINYGSTKGPSKYNLYNNFEGLLYDNNGRLVGARSEKQMGD